MSGTWDFVPMSPACPLEPHLASPNRVLGGEACGTQPPLSANRARLCYDFALRSEAIGCSCAHFPPCQGGSLLALTRRATLGFSSYQLGTAFQSGDINSRFFALIYKAHKKCLQIFFR